MYLPDFEAPRDRALCRRSLRAGRADGLFSSSCSEFPLKTVVSPSDARISGTYATIAGGPGRFPSARAINIERPLRANRPIILPPLRERAKSD